MDIVSLVLTALLFVGFMPGVLVMLPPKASKKVVLLTHTVLFTVVIAFVMSYYHTGVFELFGNYGATCPNGYAPGLSKTGVADCVPVGQATYPGTAK